MIKTPKAYGLWCPVCQRKKDKRKVTHIDKRREARAWKRDVGDGE